MVSTCRLKVNCHVTFTVWRDLRHWRAGCFQVHSLTNSRVFARGVHVLAIFTQELAGWGSIRRERSRMDESGTRYKWNVTSKFRVTRKYKRDAREGSLSKTGAHVRSCSIQRRLTWRNTWAGSSSNSNSSRHHHDTRVPPTTRVASRLATAVVGLVKREVIKRVSGSALRNYYRGWERNGKKKMRKRVRSQARSPRRKWSLSNATRYQSVVHRMRAFLKLRFQTN